MQFSRQVRSFFISPAPDFKFRQILQFPSGVSYIISGLLKDFLPDKPICLDRLKYIKLNCDWPVRGSSLAFHGVHPSALGTHEPDTAATDRCSNWRFSGCASALCSKQGPGPLGLFFTAQQLRESRILGCRRAGESRKDAWQRKG